MMPFHRRGVAADLGQRAILDATSRTVGLAQAVAGERTRVAGRKAEGVDGVVELGIAPAELEQRSLGWILLGLIVVVRTVSVHRPLDGAFSDHVVVPPVDGWVNVPSTT